MTDQGSIRAANSWRPGASPIKILQRKFYATLIFKHPDWFENLSSQSECLKNCVAYNLRCKIFIGSVPGADVVKKF